MVKTVNTWLPIYSGTYQTIWEAYCFDDDTVIESINYFRNENDKEPIDLSTDIDFDVAGICNEIAKHSIKEISKIVGEYFPKITFEKYKPTKDNFYGPDSIHIEVEISSENLEKIKKYLKDNWEAFDKYLEEKYSSRPGFCPHYSNDPNVWYSFLNIENIEKRVHEIGSIMGFIVRNEKNMDNEYEIDKEIADNMENFDICDFATNYNELLNKD